MRGQEALGGAADQRRIHHSVPSEDLAKRTRADQTDAVTVDRFPHTDEDQTQTSEAAAEAKAKAAPPPGPRPESSVSTSTLTPAGRRDHSGDITADLSDEELSAMFWTVSSSEVGIIISYL